MNFLHAGNPLWTFVPLSETTLTVGANDTAIASYQVTNHSRHSHTLTMRSIPGVTQVTSPGYCPNPFFLAYQQSCILKLSINGAALNGDIPGGPVLCDKGNTNQCYQPSQANTLQITQGPPVYYSVSGSVFGLSGALVLENNGDDALAMNADGTFSFSSLLVPGSVYLVTVQSQPATQTCTVSNGSGTITNANITNVAVNCSINTRTVGGTVSGLSGSVVLQNNGGDDLTINSNGSFTFSTSIAQGASYNVTILTQPGTQTCTVTNGSGTAGASNITNVQVNCSTNAYTVGGTVSGLIGSVVLQDNGGDNLTINSNGSYTFATSVAQGATYNVTVLTQPGAQTCTVSNGSGTMGGANVTNVNLNCVTNSTTLTRSASQLALSVTGLTEYGVTGTPSSGLARTITITNTGSSDALNIAVSSPTWPTGTTSSTTCSGTLTAGNACTITITPGATATSNGTNPCSNGTAPVAGTIQVSADNATTVSSNVVVLGYTCIYQGGYVYALDDSTPSSGSVGGKVVATADQAPTSPNGVIWSSNGSGSTSAYVVYDSIYGISEISTTSSPDPSGGSVTGQTACNGATDGSCNTNNIYVYYENFATNAPINHAYYAAGLCKQTISGYSDWYLPAICEMGYGTSPCGTSGAPTLQNIQSSLRDISGFTTPNSYFRSSTLSSPSPAGVAWYYVFSAGPYMNNYTDKSGRYGVRCSRALTL